MFRFSVKRILTKNSRLFSAEAIPNKQNVNKVTDQVDNPLTDLFGRHHTYLRISLSERCNLRFFSRQHRNDCTSPSLLFKPTNTSSKRTYSTDKSSNQLSHINPDGKATMVDITDKSETIRTATARGIVRVNYLATNLINDVTSKKGDVLSIAQIAGIMGAKKTPELIPLCHNISLTKVDVDVRLDYDKKQIEIEATVRSEGKTGVEMEALTAVSIAALTVYDMCKAVSRDIVISDISLIRKTGGRSGNCNKKPIVLRTPEQEPLDDRAEIRVGVV